MRNMELRCDQVQNYFSGGRDSVAAAAETDLFSYQLEIFIFLGKLGYKV